MSNYSNTDAIDQVKSEAVLLASSIPANIYINSGAGDLSKIELKDGCLDVEGSSSSGNNYSPIHAVMRRLGYKMVMQDGKYGYNAPADILSSIQANIYKSPKHGQMVPFGPDNYFYWNYNAKGDYVGPDSAEFLVAVAGRKYVVKVDFGVQQSVDDSGQSSACHEFFPGDRPARSVGSIGENVYAVGAESNVDVLNKLLLLWDDLNGDTIARAAGGGGSITLDRNAGGYGWFIDSSPGDNREFLATADPNIFIAKPDSEASEKINLLSVLLHEYGHILGLGHSGDARDAMTPVLQPGIRHLLSASDIAALHGLFLPATDVADGGQPGSPSRIPDPGQPLTIAGFLAFLRRRQSGGELGAPISSGM